MNPRESEPTQESKKFIDLTVEYKNLSFFEDLLNLSPAEFTSKDLSDKETGRMAHRIINQIRAIYRANFNKENFSGRTTDPNILRLQQHESAGFQSQIVELARRVEAQLREKGDSDTAYEEVFKEIFSEETAGFPGILLALLISHAMSSIYSPNSKVRPEDSGITNSTSTDIHNQQIAVFSRFFESLSGKISKYSSFTFPPEHLLKDSHKYTPFMFITALKKMIDALPPADDLEAYQIPTN